MDWKPRLLTDIRRAFIGGLLVTCFYYVLQWTPYHGGAGQAGLLSATELVWHHLDTHCYLRPYCDIEVLAVNVFLYFPWILALLLVIDLVTHWKSTRSN